MNVSIYTTSASGKTMLSKAVLRALTWAAETGISGRGDYNCVSFFCFPPSFLASPQLQWLTVLPAFMEEGKRSYTGQGKSPATVLLILPSCSRSAHGSVKHTLKHSAALGAYQSHSPSPFVIHVPHPPAKSLLF